MHQGSEIAEAVDTAATAGVTPRDRIRDIPLEDRVRILTGATPWALHGLDPLDLGAMVVSDGPIGVRGVDEEVTPSAQLPVPSAMAATWDADLAARLGRLVALEARRKNVDVVLAPVINLQRTPLGGRHFECLSEDPLLTERLAVAYVAASQAEGVGMCVKHYVGNESETERTSYLSRIDERTLREVYLPPFDAVVHDAGAWSVMAAYNRVDDGLEQAFATEHRHLVVDLLKGEWGFDGVVVSDWLAATSTVESANGGLDLVMPGPEGPWGERLVAAVREGLVSEDTIDDKVERMLRLGERVGAIGRTDDAVHGVGSPRGGIDPELYGSAETRALLRETVARSIVVLRNDGVLPLTSGADGLSGAAGSGADLPGATVSGTAVPNVPVDGDGAPRSIALIGPNALDPFFQGGGSAFVFAPYESMPQDALREAMPQTEITVARGVPGRRHAPAIEPSLVTTPNGAQGYELTLFDASGAPLGEPAVVPATDDWNRHIPRTASTAHMRAEVRLTTPGVHRLELGTSGAHSIRFDGVEVSHSDVLADSGVILDSSANHPDGPAVRIEVTDPVTVRVDADLQVVDADGYGTFVRCALRHEPHAIDVEVELAEAERVAADAEIAIVIVGTNEETESEGWDRTGLDMPGRQDELVRRVAAANPRTIVVVNAGAPVLLPWIDEVAAVVWWWLPGQEGGHGLADALTGAVEPSGRLPWTLPSRLGDCPVGDARPIDGVIDYTEGVHVGHRGWDRLGRTPAREFGFGLGYATWEYRSLTLLTAPVSPTGAQGDVLIEVEVANTAQRAGREVVQVYLEPIDDRDDRPVRRLAGFALADVEAGRSIRVTVAIPRRCFESWDVTSHSWRLIPGSYRVRAGHSSRDLRVGATVEVTRDVDPPTEEHTR